MIVYVFHDAIAINDYRNVIPTVPLLLVYFQKFLRIRNMFPQEQR